MKQFKQFIVNLVVGFVLLNIFGALFCTGSAYPFPVPQTTTVIVPFSVSPLP